MGGSFKELKELPISQDIELAHKQKGLAMLQSKIPKSYHLIMVGEVDCLLLEESNDMIYNQYTLV